ncbi:hypothetical protein Cni_G14539 [Canna indica]|uniref:Uncharacterized protein n=1 Tax=Canna indica TaxID=4628 RepID=A0AAQ3KBN2_9LILI|nr:hypothetical protein Cni_G14539 [Canna indica]
MALHYTSAHVRLASTAAPTAGRHRRSTTFLRVFAVSSSPKARFAAKRTESATVQQLQRPLAEYMSLPASQYSVLDAERIERIDENTFRCYVYRLKFFAFEVCPVLVVRVEEEPNGCCIRLLSCKVCRFLYQLAKPFFFFELAFEFDRDCGYTVIAGGFAPGGSSERKVFRSPLTLIWYGNAASMVNRISCGDGSYSSALQKLTTDTTIEVTIDVPFPFRAIPVEVIESTGTQVLDQLLRIMLPRFLAQLVKDYQAWASGDASRQPLGTGQI